MKKTTLLIALLLVAITHTFAQIKMKERFEDTMLIPKEKLAAFQEEMFQKSSHIFDARIVKLTSWEDEQGHIHTSRLVVITTPRRGKVQTGDTLEVMSRYGCIDDPKIRRSYCEYIGYKSGYGVDGVTFDGPGKNADWYSGELYESSRINTYFCKSTSAKSAFNFRGKRLQLYRSGYTVFGERTGNPPASMVGCGLRLSKQELYDRISSSSKKENGDGNAVERIQIIDQNIKFDKSVVVAGDGEVLTITYVGSCVR